MINRIKQYDWKRYNISLLGVVLVLCMISAFAVRLAGGEDDGMSYMKGQIMGICMGIVIIAILSVLDYHFICQFTAIFYVTKLLYLFVTHVRRWELTNGTNAKRWIRMLGLTFQPTELSKVYLFDAGSFLSRRSSKNVPG